MAADYMNPGIDAGLRTQSIPVLDASHESFAKYGKTFKSLDEIDLEIVRWPAQGWRPVDEDSGDEAGFTEGDFHCYWDGDILYGRNEAVGGNYILGYATDPAAAKTGHQMPAHRILLWHANYHPDGGQAFLPLEDKPYYVPLALPGDDIRPEDFVCFRFDGSTGCYIHPNIWHEGVFVAEGSHCFRDRQGRVHARVSVDFAREFQCLLEVPLP